MQRQRLLLTIALATSLASVAITGYSAGASLLPPEQKQGAISYLTGGIGMDEAQAIERKAPDYPLTLEFLVKARPRAEFTSNVKVRIEDQHGAVVLDTVSNGPFLLVDLPAGKYKVTADCGGEVKTRHIRVMDNRPKRSIFEWNQAVSRGTASAPSKG